MVWVKIRKGGRRRGGGCLDWGLLLAVVVFVFEGGGRMSWRRPVSLPASVDA